ncbi:MAG: hypothetical protein IPL61_12370 [Myxococcales bacterium]|nr:hypothetical protein [Myxococcales bacterium]
MKTLERYQPALLAVLVAAWASVVLSDRFFTDPDSYFHVGVARRLIEHGWLRRFDWLPYTTLHDPYPDMYVGQHAVLSPFVALFGVDLGLRLGIMALSSAFALSLHLVLRRRGVRWPTPWIVLAILGCPLALTYSVFLKGASTFLVLLPWFVDAVWAGAWRRTFVLAWLSVYVYVGATVLVPFALVHMVVGRWWHGGWDRRCVGATLAGLVAGMLINPMWPAHWGYVLAELRSIFTRDPTMVPGEYRGAEWAALTGAMLVQVAGVAMAAWFVVLVRQLGRAQRVSAEAASGAIAALGLLGAGLLSGTKLVELFIVFSILALPLLARDMRPWSRWIVAAAVAVGVAAATWSMGDLRTQQRGEGLARPADYALMASWLGERTERREMIVAPWDDMPGLFAFGGDQRYVAGLNMQFLHDQDRLRFEAYALLYRGVISDPEQTLIRFFDGARFILVRRLAHLPGEPALTDRLVHNPAFEELAAPTPVWRVFRRRAVGPRPP